METRRLPSFSLKTQIALVVGALVVAVAGVLSIFIDQLLSHRIRDEADSALHVVSVHAARLLATGLYERSVQVEVLASSEGLWRNGLDTPEVRQMMARTQAINRFNRWMGAADTTGKILSSTGDLLLGQDVNARPWFASAMHSVYVGDVHQAKLLASLLPPPPNGEPLRFVDFAAPIRRQGQTVGILGIHVSWDWAKETLEQALPTRAAELGIETFIFNRDGEMIYAPRDQTEVLRTAGQRLPLLPEDDDESAAATTGIHVLAWKDRKEYLTTVSKLPVHSAASDLGWYVVTRQPASVAFAEVASATRKSLLMGAVAALLGSLLGGLGARRLSADLKRIAQAAREVEAGGRAASIPMLESSHEVKVLSESLRSMTTRLLDMQDRMESLVRERTRELEAANRALDQLAHSDPLTGLLNRRGLDAYLDRQMAAARRMRRPLSLLMVDADHFKRVNDQFGHDIGDDVLRMLGRHLRERLRESDVAARYGGEEFVVVLPETDAEGAMCLAESLRKSIAMQRDARYGSITVSMGMAALHSAEDTPSDLLRRADAALYAAKASGRNRVSRYHDEPLTLPPEASG
jgi:diguanylate cyclase (GGDEF)-like protein